MPFTEIFACKPECCGNCDPVSDVVKVDASKLADKENVKPIHPQLQQAEVREFEKFKEEQRRLVEEEARRKRQQEEARRREEQEAKDRAAADAAERTALEAAAAVQMQRRRLETLEEESKREEECRLQAERELMEAQERAREEQEAAERAKKEEERLAQEKVSAWCKSNGFVNMNTSKKNFMSGTRFPIHEAVTKNDAEIVGLMLQLGVDKSVKNSKGKTAMDIADKLSKSGSMDAIISKLNGNFP